MKRVLVVCRANLFRSPLAAALLARRARELGLDLDVHSAGLEAPTALPAASECRRLAEERGLDLETHLTRPLDAELARGADLICVMEPEQVGTVRKLLPASGRTRVLCLGAFVPRDGEHAVGTIPDPAGRSREVMQRTAEAIEAAVEGLAGRLAGEPGSADQPSSS